MISQKIKNKSQTKNIKSFSEFKKAFDTNFEKIGVKSDETNLNKTRRFDKIKENPSFAF